MAQVNIDNGETYGEARAAINGNFSELYNTTRGYSSDISQLRAAVESLTQQVNTLMRAQTKFKPFTPGTQYEVGDCVTGGIGIHGICKTAYTAGANYDGRYFDTLGIQG